MSLYLHVVFNGLVSCKANGARNQFLAWLGSDLIVEYLHFRSNPLMNFKGTSSDKAYIFPS